VCCGFQNQPASFYFREGKMTGDGGLVPIPEAQTKVVQTRSLDSEVAELGLVPTLIKIDVEGWEFEVLKGAEQTIRRYRPALFLSLHPKVLAQLHTSPENVQAWLEQRGYRLDLVDKDHEMHLIARSGGFAEC